MGRLKRHLERSIKRIDAMQWLEANGYDDYHLNVMAIYLAFTMRHAQELPVKMEHVKEQAEQLYADETRRQLTERFGEPPLT